MGDVNGGRDDEVPTGYEVSTGYFRRDIMPDESCAVAVVDAVAAATGTDSAALPERLFDTVDTDALESLVTDTEGSPSLDLRVSFRFCDCLVTVSADRTVYVRDAAELQG